MTLYRKLARQPKRFLSLTGMNLHQFQELLLQFIEADQQFEQRRKAQVVGSRKERKRAIGGGGK